MRYDTIIIGAGLSGLAAGIRLAYFGQNVCLLERHYTIGGLNSFYRLRKRDFDVGLHAITNYAEPGTKKGPLSKLLRQLRLGWDDFALCPQIRSSVVFPGQRLEFTNDFSFFEQQVVESFPGQADGFSRLVARIETHDELNLDRKPLSARAVVGDFISDPLLVDMLFCPLMFYGSATPHDMDFSQFVIMFKSIFFEGFGRPFKGVRPILKRLVEQFREHGGELKLRTGVREIVSDQGRVLGVVLDDGTQLESNQVLSSAGSAETMRMCGESPDLEAGEISFVETISVIDCQPADLGHEETIVFYNDSPEFRYERPDSPVDVRSGIICSPNNFVYDEPLSDGKIRITALADPDFWMNDDEASYVVAKETACREIIESAIRFMPDFRDHVIDSDVFTPRTIRKFTGHINGCVYGAPDKLVDGQTFLDGLYVCGTDQGFLGIIGSMLSGISIANRYLLS